MYKVIDAEFRLMWSSPVVLHTQEGKRERVDGPDAALHALSHLRSDKAFRELDVAKRSCVDAIIHRGSVELARRKFLVAASKAEVLG